jgi:hypothetical protein
MKLVDVHNVVLSHEELKAALFNYVRDQLISVPDDARFAISSPQRDELRVTISWNSDEVDAPCPAAAERIERR